MTNQTDAVDAATETPPVADVEANTSQLEHVDGTPLDAIKRAFVTVDAQHAGSYDDKGDALLSQQTDETRLAEREGYTDEAFRAKDADAIETGDRRKSAFDVKAPDASISETLNEPPSRFSADAKAEWQDAPQALRDEVNRLERELSAGLEKYKDDAARFEEFRQLSDTLNQRGQRFQDVLGHYVGIEQLLAQDPVAGFEQIAHNLGTDFQSIASHYLDRSPDEVSAARDVEINALRSEVARLQERLGGVTTSMADQRTQQAISQINAFKADRPRFDELSDDIAFFLQTGKAVDLQNAYEMAERLNPAALPAADFEPVHNRSEPAVQTRLKTPLSVDGGPGSGSNPTNRKSPKTPEDAVDDAFAALGIG